MTRRNILWLVPVILLITFPLWKIPVGAYLSPPGGFDPEFVKNRRVMHNFFMEKVTIKQAENGIETADIHANRAMSTKAPNEYVLDDIVADLTDKQGDNIHVVATSGLYNQDREELRLDKDVVIVNTSDKYTMKTDLLFYYGKKKFIRSPEATVLSGDGITIHGSSFEHDMLKGTYEVGGRVTTTIEGKDLSTVR